MDILYSHDIFSCFIDGLSKVYIPVDRLVCWAVNALTWQLLIRKVHVLNPSTGVEFFEKYFDFFISVFLSKRHNFQT